VPVFAGLAVDDLSLVAEVSHPRRFGANEVVFREGDESNTCYVIAPVTPRAVREHADGRQIALATFGPGTSSASWRCSTTSAARRRSRRSTRSRRSRSSGPDMRRLMLRRPQLAVALAGNLTRRLRATNERLANQSFQTVQSRVAG
jgi:CRP/FNR family transcriptional regulator